MGAGDLLLEFVDPFRDRGSLPGGAQPSELEDPADVGAIFRLQGGAALVSLQIVVAVGHAQAALKEVGSILLGMVEVRRDPDSEDVVGVEVRHVEWIDIGPQLTAEESRQRSLVGQRRDRGEFGFDRFLPLGLDPRFVHEGQVVVADLARVGVGSALGAGGSRLLDQLLGAPIGLFGEDGERAEGSAVRRNLGGLQPGTVGVGEEIVARGDGAIDSGEIDAGFFSRRLSCRYQPGRNQNRGEAEGPELSTVAESVGAAGLRGRGAGGGGEAHVGHYGSACSQVGDSGLSSHSFFYVGAARRVLSPQGVEPVGGKEDSEEGDG